MFVSTDLHKGSIEVLDAAYITGTDKMMIVSCGMDANLTLTTLQLDSSKSYKGIIVYILFDVLLP